MAGNPDSTKGIAVNSASYSLGYLIGLQSLYPKRETLGHRVALLRDRIRRYVKNWRYHLLRERKPLSLEAIASIRDMARGFEDGREKRWL